MPSDITVDETKPNEVHINDLTNGAPVDTTEVTPDPATPTDPPADVEKDKPDLTAEQLKVELTRVRAEAAENRVKRREAETALAEAVKGTPEQVAAAVAEYQEKIATMETQQLRASIGRRFDLPDALVPLLQGTTEDELKAHAKTLAALVSPGDAGNASGGLTPDEDEDGIYDPRKLASAMRVQRKRY